MADFTRFGIAAEKALGWPAGSFLAAYRGNRSLANDIALADSILPPLLGRLLDASPNATWQGSATELLELLQRAGRRPGPFQQGVAEEAPSTQRQAPPAAPNLEGEGIQVTFDRDGSAKRSKTIKIWRTSEQGAGEASGASGASGASWSGLAPDAPDAPHTVVLRF